MNPESTTDVLFWGMGWGGVALIAIVGVIVVYFIYKMVSQSKHN